MLEIEPNSKLLFIGDSITDCERTRPVAEGPGRLGTGYVTMVDAHLSALYPERRIRVVNTGVSGDTARGLKNRWQTDVLDLRPDWLSIMIGINDVWRQFDRPRQTEIHVLPEEYEAALDEVVTRTRPTLQQLVLMTPYYIEPNRADAMRARMDQYGAIVKKLAAKHGAILVDTQAAFDKLLESCYPAAIAWDRVHPNQAGHTLLARAFLKAVGGEW